MAAPKLNDGDLYGLEEGPIPTFSTGCTPLDCALGGGWAEDRVVNLVGDKSTGKTLLAIEAAANFVRKHPKGRVIYAEAEAAFDLAYADSLGLPSKKTKLLQNEIFTVEEFFASLEEECDAKAGTGPKLYVLDSLDALSDKAERERGIDEATMAMNKPKQLHALFRRCVQKLRAARMTLIVISQVKENITVSFGEKFTRSGGKALDFFASQIVWLAPKQQIKKTRRGVERTIGVNIGAKVKKNKVGPPFRDADFPVMFSYGVDDLRACSEWLLDVSKKRYTGKKGPAVAGDLFPSKTDFEAFIKGIDSLTQEEYDAELKNFRRVMKEEWASIEEDFAPKRKKYSDGESE